MPTDPSISGRPVQWKDLSNRGRDIVSSNMRDAGRNIRQIADAHVRTLTRSSKSTPGKVATATGVAEAVEPRSVTLESAANKRQGFYNDAIDRRRAENPGDEHQVIPHGAGWYYNHHAEIAKSASQHGYDTDRAIAASGVMSPMNSPDNERASVHAIMHAKSQGKVEVTPEIVKHMATKTGKKDVTVDLSDRVGQTIHVGELPDGAVAKLSDKRIRSHVEQHSNVDFNSVARGGTRENITRAESVLSGAVHPDEAVDPHSAPKVWSYVHNTRQAKPGTGEHVEYMGRVHHDALVRTGHIEKEQGALDLYGHGESEHPEDHLLSPKSHTVEDTWQNAATFNQPNKTVKGTKTSVFKAGGSFSSNYPVAGVKTRANEETGKREVAHPDSRVSNAGLTHAFNNRATQKAAEKQSKGSGVTVPPVAVQEVGWTEMRKQAGKDPAFNQSQPKETKEVDEHKGQGVLPGMEGLIHDRRR